MPELRETLLSLDEKDYAFFKVEKSTLKEKSKEILFNYILNNHAFKLFAIKTMKIIVFEKSALNHELSEVLSDLAINKIPKNELKQQLNEKIVSGA